MPAATLLCPRGPIWVRRTKRQILDKAALIIASYMDGLDYDGRQFYLGAEDVDVILNFYDEDDVRLSSRYVLEITGYDYPDRMDMIQDILSAIAGEMKIALKAILDPDETSLEEARFTAEERNLITVSFIPVRQGCWASSGA